eukprot:TRINITY_DN34_c3_g1_i1.p1 TRINITY_DN34_c3_g1~~TRINITY_DN34_c3_g1_i1.p1  ORF type:complete len:279 (-),score=81.42 TRINITY_DN34_c3_g1_i1:223-1059(-)
MGNNNSNQSNSNQNNNSYRRRKSKSVIQSSVLTSNNKQNQTQQNNNLQRKKPQKKEYVSTPQIKIQETPNNNNYNYNNNNNNNNNNNDIFNNRIDEYKNENSVPYSKSLPVNTSIEEQLIDNFEELDLENPFSIACPYDRKCGRFEACDFPNHVFTVHANEETHTYRCPICDLQYFDLEFKVTKKTNLFKHLEKEHNDMINSSSSSSGSNFQLEKIGNGIVEEILTTSIEKDCLICFEEFYTGETIIRMECFCFYHKDCIEGWFEKKQQNLCPIHHQD